MKKKDIVNIIILFIIFNLILFFKIGLNYINGSTMDFISQHSVFPDYFRMLFYSTKELFPSFSFNLGAGQNIYYLSYYGLLSPMVLLSYLFSFIKMIDFIQLYMYLAIFSSVILMYYFLKKRFNEKISLVGSILFLTSGPLIFQTARHIMFINYMPFLILSLIGVDKYFGNNKRSLLVFSTFLIIMSSYYYSIGSILCIFIYALYKYLEKDKKIEFKKIFKFILLLIIPILMSMVLILPTIYAITKGRMDIVKNISLFEILIPNFNINEILYNAYSIGTASILLIVIIYGYFSNKQNKLISIVLSLFILFPILLYILNGFMYVRGKVLIPLLPIVILFITNFINDFKYNNIKNRDIIIIIMIMLSIITYIINGLYVFIIEIVFMYTFYLLAIKNKKVDYLIYYLIISSIACCFINNSLDTLIKRNEIITNDIKINDNTFYRIGNTYYNNINKINNINEYISSIYSSLENTNYYLFYNNKISNEISYDISSSLITPNNILFNTLMGNKYILSNYNIYGYEKLKDNIYVNNNVFPIGFSSSKVLNYDTYKKLNYPENAYALVTNIISKNGNNEYDNKVEKIDLKYEIINSNLDIEKDKNKYIINSKDNGLINIRIDDKYKNKLLFISFDMDYIEKCSNGDTSITINNVKNTLSCDTWIYPNNNNNFKYVVNGNLNIEFSKGKYIISNINTYILDYNEILKYKENISEFIIDKEKTKGDIISGNINVKDDGYFIITIPYEEKGFTIKLDNKKIDYEKVNESFIGFKIEKGIHNIEITYKSPYLKEGIVLSSIGFITFIYILYLDIKKRR